MRSNTIGLVQAPLLPGRRAHENDAAGFGRAALVGDVEVAVGVDSGADGGAEQIEFIDGGAEEHGRAAASGDAEELRRALVGHDQLTVGVDDHVGGLAEIAPFAYRVGVARGDVHLDYPRQLAVGDEQAVCVLGVHDDAVWPLEGRTGR